MDVDPKSSQRHSPDDDAETPSAPPEETRPDDARPDDARTDSRDAPLIQGVSNPAFTALLDAADRGLITGTAHADGDALLRAAITIKPANEPPPLDPDHPQFQSIMRDSVLAKIRAHANEFPDIEVCGVLVGTVYENPQAAFVYIDGMIRGEASDARSTAVTFTAETWQHIHRVMDESHPGKKIIGWYHTHPGFGIFLSEMDLFIQRHFFNAAWQMAFVLDPQSSESGMFAWRAAQVRRIEVVMDDESSGKMPSAAFPSLPNLSEPSSFSHEPSAPVNNATIEELAGRVRVLESRIKAFWFAFAFLAAVAIIWPLVAPLVLPAEKTSKPTSPQTRPVPTTGDKPNPDSVLLPLK